MNVIYADDYIKIILDESGFYYIESYKRGFPLDKLNNIVQAHPEFEISSYIALKEAIGNAPKPPQKFGRIKERLEIELSNNNLKASIIFNISREELDILKRENLKIETIKKLNELGITYGIKKDLFLQELVPGKQYIIAEGTPPINGRDSETKMFKLKEAKPEIHQDGKVDFYEMQLINRVGTGDWLGERTDATEGIPGISVKNVPIKTVNGKTLPLLFDVATVVEISNNGKTILFSKTNGAVNYKDGKINISNYLEISGNVNFRTGNIKFDGFVSIKGTVEDGFMVEATKDIEINSPLGIGNVKSIISKEGSIYIKGGIAAKANVELRAERNIYTKFIDNSSVTCGESLHIGFYCINSTISAKEIIMDSVNGHIIGGIAKAGIRVVAPIIGSEYEKKTIIEVSGFDRQSLVIELENSISRFNELKNEQHKLKLNLAGMEAKGVLNKYNLKNYNELLETMQENKQEIRNLEDSRKKLTGYLKARGEGEICVPKKVYPNCYLSIGKINIEINGVILASTFYLQDGEIKQV